MAMCRMLVVLSCYLHIVILLANVGTSLGEESEEIRVDGGNDAADTGTADETITGQLPDLQEMEFKRYVKLFEHNRAVQMDAVKSLLKSQVKDEAKFNLIQSIVHKVFEMLEEGKANLTEWGYMPGDEWPQNETVKEAASKVFENVAMFGDLILRMPDITHSIYDKNKQWEFLIGWGVWFCMESGVFKGANEKLLNLMSQELDLIPKEESYVNPYKNSEFLKDAEELDKILTEKKKKDKSNKIKEKSKNIKAKRKGPRLSGVSHTEL